MVEGGDELRLSGQDHAVAEDVARHVTDAGSRERLLLNVLVDLAEVALDRFPGAARRDAHDLVVIADAAATGKSVTKPEAIVGRDAVGDVGEGRGALVGGDDEVGVGRVPADHALRRHDLAAAVEIVGQVEQAIQERLVGAHRLGADGIDRTATRQGLGIESALGADRHDDGVLDLLRLDETQDLGAEVVLAVRPAQAAARHRTEAQVHAFDVRRPDEDFAIGLGFRQVGQFTAGDLEADIGF